MREKYDGNLKIENKLETNNIVCIKQYVKFSPKRQCYILLFIVLYLCRFGDTPKIIEIIKRINYIIIVINFFRKTSMFPENNVKCKT